MDAPDTSVIPRSSRGTGNRYKFQRLREGIRQAVVSGELQGKLPGERILAHRFKANAKTLSKALTDLAAEGVLERIIGRGTFVKGTLDALSGPGRWLLLVGSAEKDDPMIAAISSLNPNCQSIHESSGLRPSFLGQFSAVIDLCSQTPESFLRELAVRNIPVVLVCREPGTLSSHAVVADVALAGARLAREMLLHGHRRLLAVEHSKSAGLSHAVRQTTARYAPDAKVDTFSPDESAAIVGSQATAIICDSASASAKVQAAVTAAGMQIPAQVSVAAAGCGSAPFQVSGYYVSPAEMANAIAGVLRDTQITRPTVLWLTGEWQDAGTIAPIMPAASQQHSSMPMGLVT